jgi:transaldolase/glucose-6-phosphate isomerase
MSENAGSSAKVKGEVRAEEGAALRAALSGWLGKKKARDYVSVQAYIEPSEQIGQRLQEICAGLQQRSGAAVTLGYGPRFLHSTGQLHKGGPNSALVLQIVDQPSLQLAVPETNYTFDALIQAQALGDLAALKQRRRRVLRVHLGSDAAAGLAALRSALVE